MSDEDALVQWYAARDLLLGLNDKLPQRRKGLELARRCKHDEAVWFCKLFPDVMPKDCETIQQVFLAQGDDAKALCFAAFFCPNGWCDTVLIERSANMGYPFAQAWMQYVNKFDTKVIEIVGRPGEYEYADLRWAEKAALQHDPTGLRLVGKAFLNKENLAKALPLLLEAAQLGDAKAQYHYGRLQFDMYHPQRYFWFGKAAANGSLNGSHGFLRIIIAILSSNRSAPREMVFAFGAAFKGHIGSRKDSTPFNDGHWKVEHVEYAKHSVAMYDMSCNRAREAIHCWLLVAHRYHIVKDLRIMIAKMLWADRAAWCTPGVQKKKTQRKKSQEL